MVQLQIWKTPASLQLDESVPDKQAEMRPHGGQVFLRLDAEGQKQLKVHSKQLEAGREAIAKAAGTDEDAAAGLSSLKAEERKAIMEFYMASAEAKVSLLS